MFYCSHERAISFTGTFTRNSRNWQQIEWVWDIWSRKRSICRTKANFTALGGFFLLIALLVTHFLLSRWLKCLWKSIPPEAVLCQVSQGVDVEAVGSRIEPVNGPIYQAGLLCKLQESDHPSDVPSTSQHGNCWAQISKKGQVNKQQTPQPIRISLLLTSKAVLHIAKSICGICQIYDDFMLRQHQQLSRWICTDHL